MKYKKWTYTNVCASIFSYMVRGVIFMQISERTQGTPIH